MALVLVATGPGKDLAPVRRQAITWISDDLSQLGP